MPRPDEYENLIRTKVLEAVAPTAGAIEGFLRNAGSYRVIADGIEPKPEFALQRFTMAYEGYFQIIQAVLEFYEVRTRDAGRNMVIQLVSSSLGVTNGEFVFITKAHERRNGTSYRSPFPPVSLAEAAAMLEILEKYLPVARTLTGVP
jgi:hypothetical protein